MFDARSSELELLDASSCDPLLAAESYRFMEMVNRHFGGVRSVGLFIEEEARRFGVARPLRVLDVGSGCCDIPMAVCERAALKGLKLHFTCLEIGSAAYEIARARIAKAKALPIEILKEDAFAHLPSEPYDCAVSSMCFHHFSDARILELLRRLRGIVKGGILINDLERSAFAWLGAAALTSFWHEGVKHDAKLSVRRGFKAGELRALLSQLEGSSASVSSAWLCRVRAIVRFKGDAR